MKQKSEVFEAVKVKGGILIRKKLPIKKQIITLSGKGFGLQKRKPNNHRIKRRDRT